MKFSLVAEDDDDDVNVSWERLSFSQVFVFLIGHNEEWKSMTTERRQKRKKTEWYMIQLHGVYFNIVPSCSWPVSLFRNVLLINIFHWKRNRYLSNETRLIHKSSAAMHTHTNTRDVDDAILAVRKAPFFLMHAFLLLSLSEACGRIFSRTAAYIKRFLSIVVHHNTKTAFNMSENFPIFCFVFWIDCGGHRRFSSIKIQF